MNKIPRAILLMILVVVVLVGGCLAGSEAPAPSGAREGQPAPDFELQSLDGQAISLGELRGKAVLLNFWATWCRPCRYEMPFLQQIYEEWSDKQLMVLAINVGENPSRVEKFLKTYNFSLPVLLDAGGNVARKYNLTAYPTTFFIDKDGIIEAKIVGAFQNKEQIEVYLSRIVP